MNDKGVYAHLCTWFKTRDFSGRWEMWNSDYEQTPHDPDVLWFSGRRDIAALDYPLTDVYDTSDPDLIEYHCLLMKLSGIDGVIVDWDGRRLNPYRHQAFMDVAQHLGTFGIKLMVCFEEWSGYYPPGTFVDRASEIGAAKAELEWLMTELGAREMYGTVRGRKPVLVFRKCPDQWFNAEEWRPLSRTIRDAGGAVIFPYEFAPEWAPVIDGHYAWVGGFTPETRHNTLEHCEHQYVDFLERARQRVGGDQEPLVFGSVTPGFDDTRVWGWGDGPRVAPRYNGKRFERTWEMSIENNVDLVQIVTWNDWNEGSHIEPSDRFGYQYLEMNKRFAAEFKGAKDTVPDDALRVPLAIYGLRKGSHKVVDTDERRELNERLDSARDALLTGRFADAERLVSQKT